MCNIDMYLGICVIQKIFFQVIIIPTPAAFMFAYCGNWIKKPRKIKKDTYLFFLNSMLLMDNFTHKYH